MRAGPDAELMTTILGHEALDDLRHHPARVALAAAFAVLLVAWTRLIDWRPFLDAGQEWTRLADLLLPLAALALAAAPLVALRWTTLAAALAVSPVLISLYGSTGVPITVFAGLVLAGGVAWQRSRAAGAALAVGALLVVAPIILVPVSRLEVFDTINVDFQYDVDDTRIYTFLAYAVFAVLFLAVAETARRAGDRAARVRTLEARAGQVEQQSALTEERARLARDLHDVVAHHVSLIAVRAETAPYTTPDLGPGGQQVLADIAADSRRALDELRDVLGVLRRSGADPALAPLPTATDLPDLVARAADAGESVTWAEGPSRLAEVPAPIGYAAYRVLQEALTNARRHAPGRPVEVSVRGTGAGLWLRVVTRLTAPAPEPTPGRGLTGARERVEALGGTFRAGPVGDTFVVEADLRDRPTD